MLSSFGGVFVIVFVFYVLLVQRSFCLCFVCCVVTAIFMFCFVCFLFVYLFLGVCQVLNTPMKSNQISKSTCGFHLT